MAKVALADLGVLAPLAVVVSLVVAAAALFLEPDRARSLGEHAAAVREAPIMLRSRNAAFAPLATFGAVRGAS